MSASTTSSESVAASVADVEAAAVAVAAPASARREHKEVHGGAGSSNVKSVVFGGLDGVITTFSIVAAVAGASLPAQTAILMGFSNLSAFTRAHRGTRRSRLARRFRARTRASRLPGARANSLAPPPVGRARAFTRHLCAVARLHESAHR